MMNRVKAYAYSNAFVRALKSRFLTISQYDSMLKAKNDQEALRSLFETVYGYYSKELIGEALSLKKLDEFILKSFYKDYDRIMNSIKNESIKRIVSKIYSKHELDYLKTIFKGLKNNLKPKEILELIPSFLIEKNKDYSELANSKSLEEFIEKIKNEDLKEIFELALKDYEKTKSIVLTETLIDKHLYLKVWDFVQKLEDIDKKVLESIIGAEIDLANISLIVRAKQFNLPEKSIKNLIIPVRYNLLDKEIEEALKALNNLDSINALIAGYYKKPMLLEYSELARKENDVSIFETGLKRFLAILNLSSFLGYPFHVGIIVAYLNLKMFEGQDIRAILIGKRNGLENERIKKSLIMYGLIWLKSFKYVMLNKNTLKIYEEKGFRMKKAVKVLFILSIALAIISSFALITYAQAEAKPEQKSEIGLALIGASIAIAIPGLGSALGMATTSAAAIGAMAEKPEIFSKTLIYIVFIEAIAIYGLVVAFMILMKV